METKSNNAMIGAFTLAVIAAAFMFVFWFSGGRTQAGTKHYRVVFTSSVSGLSRGSTVLFNGLRVGEVEKIDLMPDPSKVFAIIGVKANTPVKIDTKARLEMQGLTGVASIALIGGEAGKPDLAGVNDEPPTIEADPSDFQNIMETVQKLSGKAETVLTRLDDLIKVNGPSITATIRNAETVTGAFAANADGIKDLMASLSSLGRTIEPVAKNIEKLTRDVQARVDAVSPDRVKSIVGNSDELMAQLNKSSVKLDRVLASLDGLLNSGDTKSVIVEIQDAARAFRVLAVNLDKRTKDIAANIKAFTGSGLRQYEALAADGRKTLDQLNRTVRSLEKNPQQFIFGAKPTIPEYSGR